MTATVTHLPTLLNTDSLSSRWDTTPGHLANLRCQGRGPRYIKLGARVMYRLEDVQAYEAAQVVETATGTPAA